jgi:hypothetical protein
MMEKNGLKYPPTDWDDALREQTLSTPPGPLFIGERRSKE